MIYLGILLIIETLLLLWMAARLIGTKPDGTIVVTDANEKKTFSMELDSDPDDLDKKKRVVFRVDADSTK